MFKSDLLKKKSERSSISKLLLCAAPLLLAGCSANNIYGLSVPTGYTNTTHGSFVHSDPGLQPIEKKMAEDLFSEPNPVEQLTTPVDTSEPAPMAAKAEMSAEHAMHGHAPMDSKVVPITPVHTDAGGPIPLTSSAHHHAGAHHMPHHSAPAHADTMMTPSPMGASAHDMGTPASFDDRWMEVSQTLVATLFKQSGTPMKSVYVTTVAGAPSANAELEHSIRKTLMGYGVGVSSEPTANPVVLEYDVVRLGAGKSDQALVTFILHKADGTVMEANRMFAVR